MRGTTFIVCLLFCSVQLAQATSPFYYGLKETFLTSDCTGQPVVSYFNIWSYCSYVSANLYQYVNVTSPDLEITISSYATSDCSGSPTAVVTQELSKCIPDTENPGSYAVFDKQPYTALDTALKMPTYTVDYYANPCAPNDPALKRIAYDPYACAYNDTDSSYRQFATCNSTHIETYFYANSNCSGEPVARNAFKMKFPDGCFVDKAAPRGRQYSCLHSPDAGSSGPGPSSTTATFSSTGGPGGPGGPANNFFYGFGTMFADSDCTGQALMHTFIILHYCYPDSGRYQFVTIDHNSSQAIITYYDTNDCTGVSIGNETRPLGVCMQDDESGNYFYFNTTALPFPEPAEHIPTLSKDKYYRCHDKEPIVERHIINPHGCIYDDENDVYVRAATCNATDVQVWTYPNSSCTGTPIISFRPIDEPEGTCSWSNPSNDLDGVIHKCLYVPQVNHTSNGGGNMGYGSTTFKPTNGNGGGSTGGYPGNGVNYGMQTKYFNPNCTGEPVGYNFIRLMSCNPAGEDKYEKVNPVSGSQISVDTFNTSDCSGKPIKTNFFPLGMCIPDPHHQGVYLIGSNNPYGSPEPPVNKSAYTIDNFKSCEEPVTFRFVYNPNGCFVEADGNYSRYSNCNSTVFEKWFFSDAQCSGAPIFKTKAHFVLPGGCFGNNPNDHEGGYKHFCLAPGGGNNGYPTNGKPNTNGPYGTSGYYSSTQGNGGMTTGGGFPGGDTYYGMQRKYYNPNCTGEPVGYNFVRLGTCNPAGDDEYERITPSSMTQAKVETYNTSNCSGQPIDVNYFPLGACIPDPEYAGVYMFTEPAPYPYPQPPINKDAYSIDNYNSCDEPVTFRFVYNPNGCILNQEGNYSRFGKCNYSSVDEWIYDNSQCAGEPIRRVSTNFDRPGGCFDNPNEHGGYKHFCLKKGNGPSSTGHGPSSTTSPKPSPTGPSITTGGNTGPYKYGVGKTYRTSDCSDDFVMAGYIILNYCTPGDEDGSEFNTVENGTAISWKWRNSDCSGPADDVEYIQLGVCTTNNDGDKGFFVKYETTVADNIDVQIKNAPVISNYASDSCSGPVLRRFLYNPASCISGDDHHDGDDHGGDDDDYEDDDDDDYPGYGYSLKYSTCNATTFTIEYYNGTSCNSTSKQTFYYPLGSCENGTQITCSGNGNAGSAASSTTKKPTTSTTGSPAGSSSTGGEAPTAKPQVVATITLTIAATFENISKVDVTALTSSFAASLGVDPSAVTVEFVLVNGTKRAAKYKMVVTVKAVVDAGTDATQLSTNAAQTVTNTLAVPTSPLATTLNSAGATVTSVPQATAQVSTQVVTTSTSSAKGTTTTTAAATSGPAPTGTTTNKESAATRAASTVLLSVVLGALVLLW